MKPMLDSFLMLLNFLEALEIIVNHITHIDCGDRTQAEKYIFDLAEKAITKAKGL